MKLARLLRRLLPLMALLGVMGVGNARVYDLELNGVSVDSYNRTDLSVIDGVEGRATYNPYSNTLTLENADISARNSYGIKNEIEGLRIELKGESSIFGKSDCLNICKATSIVGPGTLSIYHNGEGNAIVVQQPLSISGCTIIAESDAWGITGLDDGSYGDGELLTISNATVHATGSSKGAIIAFKKIMLEGCHIAEPTNAQLDRYKHAVWRYGSYATWVEIEPETYDLYINGTPVNSQNCTDLSVIDGVEGKIAYDHDSKTLSLENAKISAEKGGIGNNVEGLAIALKGENSIRGDRATLVISAKTSIVGPGKLTIDKTDQTIWVGTIFLSAPLTISGCTIIARSNWCGIEGSSMAGYQDGELLTIRNATVEATGSKHGSICDLKEIRLEGCHIASPSGAKLDADKHAVVDGSGRVITDKVVIKPEEYDLYISAQRVTSQNCDDLSVLSGVYGTVAYEPASKTLRMENTRIYTNWDEVGIWNEIEGLKIELKGENHVNGQNYTTVVLKAQTTIEGPGKLSVIQSKSKENNAIFLSAPLTISGCTIDAQSKGYGISGRYIPRPKDGDLLTIRNATVYATGSNKGSILGLEKITLEGCHLASPSGAKLDADNHAVVDGSGQFIKERVVIKPETYDLYIKGTQVNSQNCTDLSAIKGVHGKVAYDPASNTLSLENATINARSAQGIKNGIAGLKIELKGENRIEGSEDCLRIDAQTGIEGPGKLTMAHTGGGNAVFLAQPLTISGCTIIAKSDGSGIAGAAMAGYQDGELLTIRNATVYATGTTNGSIFELKEIALEDCHISSPTGAKLGDDRHAVVNASGETIKGMVTIEHGVYDLFINGTQVTSENRWDLSAIAGVEGKAAYDPASKTLTLENAVISAEDGAGIQSEIGGLKIALKGESSIEGGNDCLRIDARSTIVGPGKLTVSHTGGGNAIFVAQPLTISECTIIAKSDGLGIAGAAAAGYQDGELLTISNATVYATGSGKGSIFELKGIKLKGSHIASPEGAKLDDDRHAVVDAYGNTIKEEVIIVSEKYDLTINGTQVTSKNCADLAAISGVYGIAAYDPVSNTLTLENAEIDADATDGIKNGIEGLKIELRGKNSIEGTGNCLGLLARTSIVGPGKLSLTHTGGANAILVKRPLTISECTLIATSDNCAIAGLDDGSYEDGELLTIRNATVEATGSGKGSILELKEIRLKGCHIASPEGAQLDADSHAVVDTNGNTVKETVIIEPEKYDLYILGTQITSQNCADISSAIDGVYWGKASYDPTSKTLTLNGPIINAEDDQVDGIKSEIEGLRIVLNYDSRILGSGGNGLTLLAQTTIEGSGTLKVENESYSHSAIYVEAPLTISGCKVVAESTGFGISGANTYNDAMRLTIRNATVEAKGDRASISYFKKIRLEGVAIVAPEGARLDEEHHRVVDADGYTTDEKVKIGVKEYDLTINGTQVTSQNCDDLSAIDAVEGTATYDPDSKTLTLENAQISASAGKGIKNEIEGLTIVLKGDNSIAGDEDGLGILAKTSIEGPGTLSIDHTGWLQAIFVKQPLSISGCTIIAQSDARGITGRDDGSYEDGELLTIRNATVHATGSSKGSLFTFKEITLEDCHIASPEGARLDEDHHAVVDADGDIIKGEVVIEPGESYNIKINGKWITSKNFMDIPSAIDGVEGTVLYDPDGKVLTLMNAQIEAKEGAGIRSEMEGLRIELRGDHNSIAGERDGLSIQAKTSIEDLGTLTITHTGTGNAIFVEAPLTISECTIIAKSDDGGIAGLDDGSYEDGELLTISNATVHATGSSRGSIFAFKTIALEDCHIDSPTGAKLDDDRHAVANAEGNIIEEEVIIQPSITELHIVPSELELTEGQEESLEVSYTPANLVLPELVWGGEAGYEEIVSITPGRYARVKALKAGKTTITVRIAYPDGTIVKTSCPVTINPKEENGGGSGNGGNGSGGSGGSNSNANGGSNGHGGSNGGKHGKKAKGRLSTPVATAQLEGLSLSPNPASATLRILGLEAPAKVEVFGITGIRVMEAETDGVLNIEGLAPGAYVVRVEGRVLRFSKR